MILLIGFASITTGCASHSSAVTDAGSKIRLMYEFTKPDTGKTALAVNVYRSDVSTGPFKKLNSKPVKVTVGEPGAVAVLYTDRTVSNGRDYFYYITEVRDGGAEVKIVPVTRAQAVLRTQASPKGTES